MVAFFFLSFSFFLSFFESVWATHWAPSAVRAAKRTEAAEAELHAGRVDRWAGVKQKDIFGSMGFGTRVGRKGKRRPR